VDAAPYAQGLIKVRFYEMVCIEGVPYRYEFHVKPLLSGPLTQSEINLKTYYTVSMYQAQINPDLYNGSPFGVPGIAEAAIAIEAGDNLHPFSNQQYQVCVRAIAINGDVIGEDDNIEVVISYSNGYQGTTSVHITALPCIEFCNPIDLSINSLPEIKVSAESKPLEILVPTGLPNLNVHLFRPPEEVNQHGRDS
jgi:hypothetical protein